MKNWPMAKTLRFILLSIFSLLVFLISSQTVFANQAEETLAKGVSFGGSDPNLIVMIKFSDGSELKISASESGITGGVTVSVSISPPPGGNVSYSEMTLGGNTNYLIGTISSPDNSRLTVSISYQNGGLSGSVKYTPPPPPPPSFPPPNQSPIASFSCDSSRCPGGNSTNCIMYQPTSDINPCIFILKNNSFDPDGQIVQTKWYIKKQTEPDSSYKEIGSCSGKCDHTIQITDVPDPTIYTVKLYVRDNQGAGATFTRNLTVKREVRAEFSCSLDNSNWTVCETIKLFPGQTIFLKDNSSPSEGASISLRIWQKGDGTTFETFAQNTNNASTTLTVTQKIIRLIVTDTAQRSDREDHQILVTYPLPFFKEIPPIFFKIRDFFASLFNISLYQK